MPFQFILSFFAAGFLIKQLSLSTGIELHKSLEPFSHLGVVFLLFLVGLKINPQEIKSIGKEAALIGFLQYLVTTAVLFPILIFAFDLPLLSSFILSSALSFSSTIVATKMIYKRAEQDQLYAKIAFGILIIQDLLALALIIFATSNSVDQSFFLIFLQFVIKCLSAFLLILLGFKFLPTIEKYIYKDPEMIFLFAIAVALTFTGLFEVLGIGFELGALSAGVLLASSFYQREISSRVEPIKNLFLVIYFAFLGASVDWNFLINYGHIIAALAFLISFVLKPFIINFLMGAFGFGKHDGFKTSLVLSQISEFTILICLAAAFSSETIAAVTLVFIFTVVFSSILFENSLSLSKRIKVKWWGGSLNNHSNFSLEEPAPEIILFGAHRLGEGIIGKLKQLSPNFLIIDNNPLIINKLQDKKLQCLFGDASDVDFLQTLKLINLKMIVSTIPDREINLTLLDFLKKKRVNAVEIMLSNQKEEAEILEKAGADYVILPHYLGKQIVGEIISRKGFNKKNWHRR